MIDAREGGGLGPSISSVTPKSSFSAVCSPPLALLYKKKGKGKPSFTLQDIDLDEELCDALCKISKSSEELWKEISPPSPIGSKATPSEWIALDAAMHHASHAHLHSRTEVEGSLPDSHDAHSFESMRYPPNLASHLARGVTRNSSPSHIAPLKSSVSSSSNMLPPSSTITNSMPPPLTGHDAQPHYHNLMHGSTQLPVFSSAFPNFSNPSYNPPSNNSTPAMDSSFNSGQPPSITTNSISISGNVNINIQNPAHAQLNSPSSSTTVHAHPTQQLVPPDQDSYKKPTRKAAAATSQFSGQYSPQLKIHQYVPPTQPEETFSASPNMGVKTNGNGSASPEKVRQHENEKLWSEVVVGCNKLMGHAARGSLQPLPWGEFNDSMNSARQIMASLVSLLQLNSYAYANIYNSVAGYGMQVGDDSSNPFARFQQYDPFVANGMLNGMNMLNSNMGMNMNMNMNMNMQTVEPKKESREEPAIYSNVNTAQPLPSFAFDDMRRKLPRRNSNSVSGSRDLSPDPTNIPMTHSALHSSMSLPNISLSPVISALSNLTPMHSSPIASSSDSAISAGGSSSDDGSTPVRSYMANSTEATKSSSGNWKKTRGKKRSKYSDLDLMCLSCGVKQTPEWRRGPAGAKTLCNACGLHWAKVLKAEGKASAGDSKKAYLLEQKRNQFMLLAKRQDMDTDIPDADSPQIKSEPGQ